MVTKGDPLRHVKQLTFKRIDHICDLVSMILFSHRDNLNKLFLKKSIDTFFLPKRVHLIWRLRSDKIMLTSRNLNTKHS